MESTPPLSPDDAREALSQVASARLRMADGLRLPSWFHASLGLAIAVLVDTTAWAAAGTWSRAWSTALVSGAIVLFLAVAGVELWRFRHLNGAWIGGLVDRAVLGTSLLSTLVSTVGLAAALWAGFQGLWWLVAMVSIATGAGYAWAAQRWWASYRKDPEGRAHGDSRTTLVLIALLAAGGLVLAVASR